MRYFPGAVQFCDRHVTLAHHSMRGKKNPLKRSVIAKGNSLARVMQFFEKRVDLGIAQCVSPLHGTGSQEE
jgi:hypothetical protein